MQSKNIIVLLFVLNFIIYADETQQLLRHDLSFSSSLASSLAPTSVSGAMSTLETCKDVGSTWNSVTGKVDNIKGTWQGDECNSKCTAQKGIVCGNVLKDCCAMECQGSFLYKYCKFDLKLNRQMMQCGA